MQDALTLSQLQRLSFRKIKQMQDKKFHATCKYMLPHTTFYKKLFSEFKVDPESIKSVEDWHRKGLPLIKKATYMKNPKDFVVRIDKSEIFGTHIKYLASKGMYSEIMRLLAGPDRRERVKNFYMPKMLVFSGGTESNNPTPMLITQSQKQDLLLPLLKDIGDFLLKKFNSDKLIGMNLFPYAPHLGWHSVHHALDLSCDLNLCTAAGGAVSTERLVKLADKFKPNVICGMNDYIRNRFLKLAVKNKVKLPKKALFINGAQKMIEPEREMIKQMARKAGVTQPIVLDLYGASETKEALMPELSEGKGFYHVAPLTTILETVKVNRSGKDLIEDWEFSENGLLTSWNIDGAGSQLHGYIIGDTVEKVIQDKCKITGLNAKRFQNLNRLREVSAQMELTGMVEAKVKGTRINLVSLRERAMKLPEVEEAQVQVNKNRNKIELKVVTTKYKTVKKKLEKALLEYEVKIKLTQATMEKLAGDKLKYEPIKLK